MAKTTKKPAVKKKPVTVKKETDLIKVLMLCDMTLNGKELPCGTIQHIPPKAAGMWSTFSRQYVKIL